MSLFLRLFGRNEDLLEALDRTDAVADEVLLQKTVEYIWNDDKELLAAIRAAGSGRINQAIYTHAKQMIKEQRG